MTDAERPGLDAMVERIRGIAVSGLSHPDAGSLLHAYIACLPVPDLCLAIAETLQAPSKLRLALRGRLVRLLRDGDLAQRDREHVHVHVHGAAVELSVLANGPKRTCRADLTMSVDGGRAEVGGTQPNRRD